MKALDKIIQALESDITRWERGKRAYPDGNLDYRASPVEITLTTYARNTAGAVSVQIVLYSDLEYHAVLHLDGVHVRLSDTDGRRLYEAAIEAIIRQKDPTQEELYHKLISLEFPS